MADESAANFWASFAAHDACVRFFDKQTPLETSSGDAYILGRRLHS